MWRSSGSADPSCALLCASAHAAAVLGLESKGHLRPGADADIVLLDDELSVRACFVRGRLAYQHRDMHGAFWWYR